MTVIDKKEESFIAEYMQLLRRTDELLEAAAQEKKNSPPEKQPELDDRIEDIKAISPLFTHSAAGQPEVESFDRRPNT
jgi:hypothetical protein